MEMDVAIDGAPEPLNGRDGALRPLAMPWRRARRRRKLKSARA
jgi:hypothetical protein